MSISEDFLLTIAALAITLIGFSGVVSTLGHRGEGEWTSSEKLQLQTLVEPALVALFGAFVPVIAGLVIENTDVIWRISNGFLLSFHVVAFGLFLKRERSTKTHISQKFMSLITVAVLILQIGSIFGLTVYHELAFALSLLLGISVSAVNFYLLLFVTEEEGV